LGLKFNVDEKLYVVVKGDADKVKHWSDKDVIMQWHKGFKAHY